MKKRVTAELISIAHRILKLKNHAETLQLQLEAKNLYDQLTILRFYEENFELVKTEISEDVLLEKLEGKPTEVFNTPIQDQKVDISEETIIESKPEFEVPQPEPISEEKIVIAELIVEDDEEEEILMTSVEEEPLEVENTEVKIPETQKAEEPVAKQISFEDLLVHDYKELDFVKVEDIPAAVAQSNNTTFETVTPEVANTLNTEPIEKPALIENEVVKAVDKIQKEEKILSLNDKLNRGINIGLNDRIAFEKKLFGGNAEDFNRVISQLNTFDSFEEAKGFIKDFVKPDYNNWTGNEEFETRFLEIVEKKFN